jgi:hypothetical protein
MGGGQGPLVEVSESRNLLLLRNSPFCVNRLLMLVFIIALIVYTWWAIADRLESGLETVTGMMTSDTIEEHVFCRRARGFLQVIISDAVDDNASSRPDAFDVHVP